MNYKCVSGSQIHSYILHIHCCLVLQNSKKIFLKIVLLKCQTVLKNKTWRTEQKQPFVIWKTEPFYLRIVSSRPSCVHFWNILCVTLKREGESCGSTSDGECWWLEWNRPELLSEKPVLQEHTVTWSDSQSSAAGILFPSSSVLPSPQIIQNLLADEHMQTISNTAPFYILKHWWKNWRCCRIRFI